MDWTWSKVFSLAQVQSGLLGRGQVANGSLLAESQDMAMLILDEWDGKGLALPDLYISIAFDTVAGQSRYQLGTTDPFVPRPETIVTATLTIATGPVQRVQLMPMPMAGYTLIPIPSTQGQPFDYAYNPKWPTADFYLYPTPNRVYTVDLNCKVTWATTITTPDINPFAIVEVPSGFAAALVAKLALKLAKRYRMETPALIAEASAAEFTILSQVVQQYRKDNADVPMGLFSDVLIRSGVNP